jgi:hypothetical protein
MGSALPGHNIGVGNQVTLALQNVVTLQDHHGGQ